jgi:putative transposase
MSHAYARNYLHVVFSTYERRKVIRGEHRERLWAYMRGIGDEYGVSTIEIGGTDDHVHLVVAMPPKISLATWLRTVKANSSKWMNENGHLFAWQRGYGAFSVSSSNLENVCRYVREQERHHARLRFEDEFVALLKKHGVEYTAEHVFG